MCGVCVCVNVCVCMYECEEGTTTKSQHLLHTTICTADVGSVDEECERMSMGGVCIYDFYRHIPYVVPTNGGVIIITRTPPVGAAPRPPPVAASSPSASSSVTASASESASASADAVKATAPGRHSSSTAPPPAVSGDG